MSGSNPFRRKQQAQANNHANLGASQDDIDGATLRFPALDTESAPSVSKTTNAKKVRIISPHSSTYSPDLEQNNEDSNFKGSTSSLITWGLHNDHTRPEHKADSFSGDESPIDPFQAGAISGSNTDTDEEREPYSEPIDKIHSVPPKARSTLNVDSDNPWRTSTLIGNYPGNNNTLEHGFVDDTRGVPTKAQKTLGILRAGRLNDSSQRYPLPSNTQAVPAKAQRTLGIPSNPFQKDSALVDKGYGDKTEEVASSNTRNPSLQSSRPQLDVDAFTRLLMTGDKPSSAASTPSVNILPIQGILADSSSNTDASSLSRQSIQESQTELHIETPRTSHESSPSIDEVNMLTRRPASLYDMSSSRTSRNGEKSGRAGPMLAEFLIRRSSTDIDQLATTPPRLSTDLNKPLPPPPISTSPESGSINSGATLSTASDFTIGPHELGTPRSRVAPAPPLARRSSQLRSKYPGAASGRSVPIAEENAYASQVSIPSPSPTQGKSQAPPPPPRRRGTDPNSIVLEPPELPELGSSSPKASPKPKKQPPQLPPARTTSVSKRRMREASAASVPGALPPPPPPRRRGSSASSLSLPPRTSIELGSPSEEVTRPPVPAPGDDSASKSSANIISKAAAGSRDVLADLSKLQQEVDALRGIYGRRSSVDQSQ